MSRRRRATPDPQAALVFDAAAGEALKQDGIARSARSAGDTWNLTMDGVPRLICRATLKDEITTDDLWRRIEHSPALWPREPRALGAVMLSGARAGWLKKTDRVRPSERAQCHRRPMRVWQILRRM